jgi:hypothetical protein
MKTFSRPFNLRHIFSPTLITLMLLIGETSYAMEYIDYHGLKVRLKRDYKSFSEYKNDDQNIHSDSLALLQKKMKEIQMPSFFHNIEELTRGQRDFAFPGYGTSSLYVVFQHNNSNFSLCDFEIPDFGYRHLLFVDLGTSYQLVDDFITSGDESIRVSFDPRSEIITYTTKKDTLRQKRLIFYPNADVPDVGGDSDRIQ